MYNKLPESEYNIIKNKFNNIDYLYRCLYVGDNEIEQLSYEWGEAIDYLKNKYDIPLNDIKLLYKVYNDLLTETYSDYEDELMNKLKKYISNIEICELSFNIWETILMSKSYDEYVETINELNLYNII